MNTNEFFCLLDDSLSCSPSYFSILWEDIFKVIRTKTGGTILFAGGIGSRLYNLNEENSDLDMFIVYQAPSSSFMKYEKQLTSIFKSKDNQSPDYSVYELSAFCNLLLASDSRAIELLYSAYQHPNANPSLIYLIHPSFKAIIEGRKQFLAVTCATKYLSEFNGVKGIKKLISHHKYMEKCREDPSKAIEYQTARSRIEKGLYILHRLLYQARIILSIFSIDVAFPPCLAEFEVMRPPARMKQFTCYFPDGPTRNALLEIRRGNSKCTFEEHFSFLKDNFNLLQEKSISFPTIHNDINTALKEIIEDLLMERRLSFLKREIPQLHKISRSHSVDNLVASQSRCVNLPPVPGTLLLSFQHNGNGYGVYLSHLPILFTSRPLDFAPHVITRDGYTIYEFRRWIAQLDKGNPNITEFLLWSFDFVEFVHPLWDSFITHLELSLVSSLSINGAFIAVQQAARKLNRGERVSKRKWKQNKKTPVPAHLLPFPEDALPYTSLIRFLARLFEQSKRKGSVVSFREVQVQIQEESALSPNFADIMALLRDSENEWDSVISKRLLSQENESFISSWLKEIYIHTVSLTKKTSK